MLSSEYTGHGVSAALLSVSVLNTIKFQSLVNIDFRCPDQVLEGFSDLSGPYIIRLSNTVNFNETNVFPPVSGAMVKISDYDGNSEDLIEKSPGIYFLILYHKA
jgi:hypothetical protein